MIKVSIVHNKLIGRYIETFTSRVRSEGVVEIQHALQQIGSFTA